VVVTGVHFLPVRAQALPNAGVDPNENRSTTQQLSRGRSGVFLLRRQDEKGRFYSGFFLFPNPELPQIHSNSLRYEKPKCYVHLLGPGPDSNNINR
jgi:hypothetical protein